MLEQLGVEPGHRVLEIGAGTGYNAALLAHLAGDGGAVTTVDIDEDLVLGARARLAACGLERVRVERGDGGFGWLPGAPYDRIVLTVGAADIAPAWVAQLAPGGRLLLPLSLRGAQRTVAFERAAAGLESVSSHACGFMALRGAFAGRAQLVALGEGTGIFAELPEARPVDAAALSAALARPGAEVTTGVRAVAAEVWDSLALCLALHEPRIASLFAFAGAPGHALVPALVGLPTQAFTAALVAKRSLAALVAGEPADDGSFALAARAFGDGGDALAAQLANRVRAWDVAGRPATDHARVRAELHREGTSAAEGATIDLPHARLTVSWDG
jgi:protein-L-isoaspartate(D-aspartate) O-methyltransferase